MKRLFLLFAFAAPVWAGAFDDAVASFKDGKFQEALARAGEVSESDDAYPRARYLMGEIQLLLGEAGPAAESLKEALSRRSDSTVIRTALGRALVAQKEPEAAIQVLEPAVKKDPKFGRARAFLGVARFHASGGRKGAKDVKAGLKLAPNDPEVARAAVLLWIDDEGKRRDALGAARKFKRANKKHAMGPFLLALVYERMQQHDEAIEEYQAAIALDDTFVDAHKNLAILCVAHNPLYKNKERTRLAFQHFERYEQLGGKDPEVLKIYATIKKVLPPSYR